MQTFIWMQWWKIGKISTHSDQDLEEEFKDFNLSAKIMVFGGRAIKVLVYIDFHLIDLFFQLARIKLSCSKPSDFYRF